jgi:hypothetical protein
MKKHPVSFLLVSTILALVPANTGWTQTAAQLLRGPYLQSGTPTSVVVRWRTDLATDSRVRYGNAPDALGSSAGESTPVTEHEVVLAGLSPATRYCYSVGSTSQTLSGGNEAHCFTTAPQPGSTQPIRIWAFGDAGFGDANQAAVRDGYLAHAAGRRTDVWLMLGDNAYDFGTDAEYQAKLFDMYPSLLGNTVLWSTFGNHEGSSSSSASQSGPYYDSFTFPTAGEAGGAPSGTEAYYSFDYGNVHFVSLNSHDVPRSPSDPMLTWLRNDLAQNTRQWTIAFFHHPPYSKGSHDSDNPADSEGRMQDMRENALPILEEFGVDLVLTGHSHSYERSFLVDRHYGVSSTLTETMKVDSGDGRPWSDGAYFRPVDVLADSHAGMVHAVSGAAGRIDTRGPLGHPVMVSSLEVLGSLVLDVNGPTLEGKFLDTRGVARDGFAIEKAAAAPARPRQAEIADDSEPDRTAGVDGDGSYRLSWGYPPAAAERPCGFRVEESRLTQPAFVDAGEEPLVAGSNTAWQGDTGWTSGPHPGTATLGYWLAYTDSADTALAMRSAVALPAGRAAVLTFSSFESIELDFDFGFVELSANGGPYQTLATFTGDFSGTRALDLSGFAGQSVRVRFRLTSDSLVSFPAQLGWFVDDVRIRIGAFGPIADLAVPASAFDVAGRGAGFWGYRVAGLFGDCAGAPAAGLPSRVRLVEVAGAAVATVPPTADFNASPNPAEVGEPVRFDASASRDNDSEGSEPRIVRYFWAFGDGAVETTTAASTTHPYSAAGTYRATLTVTDNDGESSSAELFVEVDSPPPPGGHEATGGGHIVVGGEKANFGFDAESSIAGTSGHLTYHDRAGDVKVDGRSVTSLSVTGNRATIRGTCALNKVPGFTFTLDVVDGGRGAADEFRIRLSNGYEAGGPVGGGNIQVE